MLKQMQVSDYPHLKKEDRKRIYKQLNEMAYPSGLVKKDTIKSEDAAQMIQRMLNG